MPTKITANKLAAILLILAVAMIGSSALAAEKPSAPARQAGEIGSNITFLKKILADNPDIKKALLESLKIADWKGIKTLDEYYAYLARTEKLIPKARTILQEILEFYYLIDQSKYLNDSKLFQEWVVRFARDWGKFLDTPESIEHLESFYRDKSFHMEDYYVAPSGWLTFNQFFAREIKPGKRPVAPPAALPNVSGPTECAGRSAWYFDNPSRPTQVILCDNICGAIDGEISLEFGCATIKL